MDGTPKLLQLQFVILMELQTGLGHFWIYVEATSLPIVAYRARPLHDTGGSHRQFRTPPPGTTPKFTKFCLALPFPR